MKRFARCFLGLLALAVVGSTAASCGVTDPSVPQTTDATVRSHFFPIDQNTIYTYKRFNDNRGYDTLVCRLDVSQPGADTNKLVITNGANSLYTIGFTKDAYGNLAAVLATDTSTLLALDGNLAIGNSWTADPVHGIVATVVEHDDEYYPPGRTIHYSDVLVVKYHEQGQPETSYTLRFFARGMGLIFERQIVQATTDISSLQLISVTYPTDIGNGGKHEHHYPQTMSMMPAFTLDPSQYY